MLSNQIASKKFSYRPLSPTLPGCLFRNGGPLLSRQVRIARFGSGFARVDLFGRTRGFLNLASGDLGNHYRRRNRIGGALLALGASGHRRVSSVLPQAYALLEVGLQALNCCGFFKLRHYRNLGLTREGCLLHDWRPSAAVGIPNRR